VIVGDESPQPLPGQRQIQAGQIQTGQIQAGKATANPE